MATPSPVAAAPRATRNLAEFLKTQNTIGSGNDIHADTQPEPVLMNNVDDDDDDDGDSTIEESWRPLPEKRRILAEAAEAASTSTPMSNKSSLDSFLDALISDTKQSTNDDLEQHSLGRRSARKGRRPRVGSSAASVGSALERPSIFVRNNHHHPLDHPPQHIEGGFIGSGAATVHGGERDTESTSSARTSGVLWARKSRARRARPSTGAARMSSGGSVSSQRRRSPAKSRGVVSREDGDLTAFLERESRHGRPTDAHSVSGDRVASGAISIVLSESGTSKTFTVGAREAKLVEKLLQATNELQSPKPITSTKSMKGWLEQVAGNLKSPSGHSEIANSARVSTRSSLAVELSPPLDDGKSSLKSYLDKKRGRRPNSSAFTVAGDRVSVRFQGKSTQELLELLDADKNKPKIPIAPPLTGPTPRRHRSHTAAQHPRLNTGSELENLKYSGTGASPFDNSMPALGGFDPFDLNNNDDDDIRGSDRLFPRSTDAPLSPANRKDVQSMLDGRRSSNENNMPGGRRARSTTPSKRRPTDFAGSSINDHAMTASANRPRASSTPRGTMARPTTPTGAAKKERLGDSMNFKDVDLSDFRPPASSRPTNRRSMMRKMQSVPILSDTNFDLDDDAKNDRVRPTVKKGQRKKCKSDASRVSTSSAKSSGSKSKSNTKKTSPTTVREKDQDKEMDFEELNKSFLDMYLDGDVEANDSASQLHNRNLPENVENARLAAKDEYKATLVDAPIENSISKLRIQPDFLESTNRIILQDPAKPPSSRRDLLKKMKSVPSMSSPSMALKDLYDSPKVLPDTKIKLDTDVDDDINIKLKEPPKTPTGEEKAKVSKGSANKKKGKNSGKKKKTKSINSSTVAEEHMKKSKSVDGDEPKSPKKKKNAKTPKGKKGKVSKEDKDGKKSTEKKGRRGSGKHKTIVDDDNNSVKKEGRRGSGKHKTAADDFPRPKNDDKKPERGGMLRKAQSLSNLNLDAISLDETDRLLVEKMNALRSAPSSPQTPTSERLTLGGEKPLRKGRKPKNPNLMSPNAGPSDARTPQMGVDSRWAGMSPRTSPRRERESEILSTASPKLPMLPFISAGSADEMVGSEYVGVQTPTSRKSAYQLNSQGLRPALKGDYVNPPQSPRRYSRPIPTVGRENTVLECHDDDSVVSDITDTFSMDITEADIEKAKTRHTTSDLVRIDEPDGEEEETTAEKAKKPGSWADLSHSYKGSGDAEDADREKQVHQSRRWNSMRDLSTAPKTPMRGETGQQNDQFDSGVTKTPTRLGWLKKKLGLKKKH